MAQPPGASGPAFIGRGRELAALADALARPPALVVVEGEAGIGKSRLVRELLASPPVRGRRALVALCPPFREPHTLGPVIDAVREAAGAAPPAGLSLLAGALRPFFPEWAAQLPPVPEPLADARAARHRLFRALAELVGRLDAAVLVAEDVHWADDATAEFLLFLAAGGGLRPSLVVTYRPEDLPDGSLVTRLPARLPAGATQLRLPLGTLDLADAAAVASSMLPGGDVSEELARFVHGHTAGVPLAVEELVRLLSDRADLAESDRGWVRRSRDGVEVPPTVRDSVRERARRHGAPAQEVLRAAAVLADPADPATLARASGLDPEEADRGVTALVRTGLLREDPPGLLSFRHALAGKAVYEAIPPPRRRALHRRVAGLLEDRTPPPVARLARHFRAAGDAVGWLRYAELAADAALRAGDERAAATLLCELLASKDLPVARVAPLVERLPYAGFVRPGQVETLARELRALLDGSAGALTGPERAVIRFQLGRALSSGYRWEVAAVELERALAELPPGSPEAVRAMIMLAKPRLTGGDAGACRRWLWRSAAADPPPAPADRLSLTVGRASVLLDLGEEAGWAELAALPADSATPAMRSHLARGHLTAGDAAMRWGRYPEAARRLAAARRLTERYQLTAVHDTVVATEMHLDWFRGEWAGLEERASGYAADPDIRLVDGTEARLVGALLRAAAARPVGGEPVVAELAAVLADSHDQGLAEVHLEAAGALARLHLVTGDPAAALAVTDAPLALAVAREGWLWVSQVVAVRVAALAAAGEPGTGGELVTGLGDWLRGRDIPAARAALREARAGLAEGRGEWARAAAGYRHAARAWEALPYPYQGLLARERMGAALVAARPDAGAAALTEVLSGLSALGARGDADRVRRRLRELGVPARRPRGGGRQAYGDRLSPRELDVVRLVVGGRTNRQIAADLVLSVQTVTGHVRSAMRKLDVSSRTALAVRAVSLGLVTDDHPEPAA